MMRAWLAGLGTAAMTVGTPLAVADPDDSQESMSEVPASGDVCDQARAQLEAAAAPCNVIATRQLLGGHRATLVEIRGDQHGEMAQYLAPDVDMTDKRLTRYVIAVDAVDHRRWLSTSLDHLDVTETAPRPALRSLNAQGTAAVAVDVSAPYAPNATDRRPTRTFLACRDTSAGEWTCVREEIDASDAAQCAVSLAQVGMLPDRPDASAVTWASAPVRRRGAAVPPSAPGMASHLDSSARRA